MGKGWAEARKGREPASSGGGRGKAGGGDRRGRRGQRVLAPSDHSVQHDLSHDIPASHCPLTPTAHLPDHLKFHLLGVSPNSHHLGAFLQGPVHALHSTFSASLTLPPQRGSELHMQGLHLTRLSQFPQCRCLTQQETSVDRMNKCGKRTASEQS